jgi:hypothetical protein
MHTASKSDEHRSTVFDEKVGVLGDTNLDTPKVLQPVPVFFFIGEQKPRF